MAAGIRVTGTNLNERCKQMNDNAIEQEIQDKVLTAPRITPDDIAENIASEHYFTAADGVMGNDDISDSTLLNKPGRSRTEVASHM